MLHDPYAEHFNLVDLANKTLQSTDDKHRKPSWKIRMPIYILRTVVLNAYRTSFRRENAHFELGGASWQLRWAGEPTDEMKEE